MNDYVMPPQPHTPGSKNFEKRTWLEELWEGAALDVARADHDGDAVLSGAVHGEGHACHVGVDGLHAAVLRGGGHLHAPVHDLHQHAVRVRYRVRLPVLLVKLERKITGLETAVHLQVFW